MRNSTCYNENCTFVHLKGTKRSRPSRDHSHDRDQHHHSSRDRNSRARYTSHSRAEHPRRDPRPHSGHPHQSTDRRGSRPQTPANYPPREHDRSPIPAAPVSNNSYEVSFFIIENASEHEERLPAGPLGHTTEHSPPTIPDDFTSLSGTSTASLRPSFFNSPGQPHSPIAPSSGQPQCPFLDAEYSSILLLNAQSVNPSAQSLCKWKLPFTQHPYQYTYTWYIRILVEKLYNGYSNTY